MIIHYFGRLTGARKGNWNNGDENPYDVTVENIRVFDRFPYENCFHDEIWVDWGTKAKKATGRELLDEMARAGCEGNVIEGIPIDENEEYGFVSMETVTEGRYYAGY